ncbi:MAG: hypothetical protein WCJ25_01085 [Candidatus Moraniibacteriota bacterium]
MKHDTDIHESSDRFAYFALGCIFFSWSAYALASAGVFSHLAVIMLSIISVVAIAILFLRFIVSESIVAKAVTAFVIAYAVLLLYGSTPTIFSGRDQGSVAEAAIELSQNGNLTFSSPAIDTFFSIYGPGKALNFPGFAYTADGSLQSQFPTSSISWLGAFHSLFGLSGLIIGNGVLLVLSLLTLFVLVRLLGGETAAVGSVLIATASFLPSWFAKFTLTENLALFLFLSLSLSIILFLKNPSRTHLLAVLLSGTLLAVTRIEGLPLLAIVFGILFLSKSGRDFFNARPSFLRTMPLIAVLSVLALDLLSALPRYTSLAKALLQNVSHVGTGSGIADRLLTAIPLWGLFIPYGLLPVIILGLIGVAILLVRKERLALIPVLLAFPTFLYLVDPNISADHPWMLRRLLFSVWPVLLISFSVGLSSIFSNRGTFGKRIILAISTLVALSGIFPTISTFAFSENGKLTNETRELASLIGPRDLILIDRDATGDPYAIPAGPLRFLFGKNAAYFFNPEDFAKIPKDRYDHIYLLSPADNLGQWSALPASLSLVSTVSFETERLGPLPAGDSRFPERNTVTTDSFLFSLDPL